ncbi:MAG: hypothetical protein V8T09_05485 [Oscillospiraceae bacterium]
MEAAACDAEKLGELYRQRQEVEAQLEQEMTRWEELSLQLRNRRTDMSDILCIYYSRTGHTRRAVKEIAEALDAEIVAITDGARPQRLEGLPAQRHGRHEAVHQAPEPL